MPRKKNPKRRALGRNDFLDRNQQAGYQARMAGKPISANPHDGRTPVGAGWRQGWQLAEKILRSGPKPMPKNNPRKRKRKRKFMTSGEARIFFDRMYDADERKAQAAQDAFARTPEGKAAILAHNDRLIATLRAKRLNKNPADAFIIYTITKTGKHLTYDAVKNRFTDNSPPSLFRSLQAAERRAKMLLEQYAGSLTGHKIYVKRATEKERGPVFGARPRRENPGKRGTLAVGDTVKYRADFLRSVGLYTGEIPFARGTITEIEMLPGGLALASIDWEGKASVTKEIPKRVNVANLEKARPKS